MQTVKYYANSYFKAFEETKSDLCSKGCKKKKVNLLQQFSDDFNRLLK